MKVKLIAQTPNAIGVLYKAMRTCYCEFSPEESDEKTMLKLVKKVIESRHFSPLEHINFTFMISGISRACSHQLVRHRHCSFSQQSQRYVKASNPEFYIPDSLAGNMDAYSIYISTLEKTLNAYSKLIELGIKAEDARMVLPNATCSNMTMTLNFRELMHIAHERLCSKAQKEIRTLVGKMCAEVVSAESWTKEFLHPKCETLGYCTEHNGCGRVQGK